MGPAAIDRLPALEDGGTPGPARRDRSTRSGPLMRAISLLFHDVHETSPDESGFRSAAADRYKLRLADFDAQLEGVAAVRDDIFQLSPCLRDSMDRGGNPFLITCDEGGGY